jgi:hypothetical protein
LENKGHAVDVLNDPTKVLENFKEADDDAIDEIGEGAYYYRPLQIFLKI